MNKQTLRLYLLHSSNRRVNCDVTAVQATHSPADMDRRLRRVISNRNHYKIWCMAGSVVKSCVCVISRDSYVTVDKLRYPRLWPVTPGPSTIHITLVTVWSFNLCYITNLALWDLSTMRKHSVTNNSHFVALKIVKKAELSVALGSRWLLAHLLSPSFVRRCLRNDRGAENDS